MIFDYIFLNEEVYTTSKRKPGWKKLNGGKKMREKTARSDIGV